MYAYNGTTNQLSKSYTIVVVPVLLPSVSMWVTKWASAECNIMLSLAILPSDIRTVFKLVIGPPSLLILPSHVVPVGSNILIYITTTHYRITVNIINIHFISTTNSTWWILLFWQLWIVKVQMSQLTAVKTCTLAYQPQVVPSPLMLAYTGTKVGWLWAMEVA